MTNNKQSLKWRVYEGTEPVTYFKIFYESSHQTHETERLYALQSKHKTENKHTVDQNWYALTLKDIILSQSL